MRALAAWAVVGAAVVLLSGCNGAHPAAPPVAGGSTTVSRASVSASAPSPGISVPVTATSPSGSAVPTDAATAPAAPTADACAAFDHFHDDLRAHGPAAVGQLLPEAQAVQQEASEAAAFGDPADASFLDDANALLAYAEQPDFPTTGSLAADPVQEMVQDCS